MSRQHEALIREMGPDDVAGVAQLELRSYTFPWSEGIFRDCVRAGYYCLVAQIEEACVGYAIMSLGAGEAHVLNLCVDEGSRRQGLGADLLEQLVEFAAASGVREMFLEVRPSNGAAIHLYRTHGFTQIGLRRGYYQAVDGREDAVVLRRHISGRGR